MNVAWVSQQYVCCKTNSGAGIYTPVGTTAQGKVSDCGTRLATLLGTRAASLPSRWLAGRTSHPVFELTTEFFIMFERTQKLTCLK